MRIAFESNCDEKKYLALLKKRTKLCCQVLDVQRHIIQRNIEKGLLPNFCDGGIEMSKCYSTVGILGLYEVIEKFGYTCRDEFGFLGKEIIDEVQNWNEDIRYYKAAQDDFWVGIFHPNVYDEFETIDYDTYNNVN
jgi:anaerobic ribonucleoside-triphosphate reductase